MLSLLLLRRAAAAATNLTACLLEVIAPCMLPLLLGLLLFAAAEAGATVLLPTPIAKAQCFESCRVLRSGTSTWILAVYGRRFVNSLIFCCAWFKPRMCFSDIDIEALVRVCTNIRVVFLLL